MKHRLTILLYALSIMVICLLLSEKSYFVPILIGVTALFVIIVSSGVLFLKLNYFLTSVNRLDSREVLLTFDDGPHPTRTPKILDILAKHNCKAIFFVVGKHAEEYPDIVLRIKQEGHLIGNHSYAHNNFMSMYSTKRLREEILHGQRALSKISGIETSLFRPPIGYTNPKYAKVLKELKLTNVGWTVRSYDSVYKDPQKLKKRILAKTKPGSILLFHDNLEVTVEALEEIIVALSTNGTKFVNGDTIKTVIHA